MLEQLFQVLQYDGRTHICVYFILTDVVYHKVNAGLFLIHFFSYPFKFYIFMCIKTSIYMIEMTSQVVC